MDIIKDVVAQNLFIIEVRRNVALANIIDPLHVNFFIGLVAE
jgi:hypothetical protein